MLCLKGKKKMLTLTKNNFKETIEQTEKPVIVDFWAPWCGPCRMLTPIMENIGSELGDDVIVAKVNVDEEMELALGGSELGNIDVEVANGVALETLPLGLVDVHVRKARDAMPLETSMQRRACKMRDRRLQSIEAVIEREQRVAAKRNDDGLFILAENG